jgi:hypothetical protein
MGQVEGKKKEKRERDLAVVALHLCTKSMYNVTCQRKLKKQEKRYQVSRGVSIIN